MTTMRETKTNTQEARLIAALKYRPMTTLEIIVSLGIVRPAAVVLNLRRAGWDIDKEMVGVKNRFGEDCRVARYRLESAIPRASMAENMRAAERGRVLQHKAALLNLTGEADPGPAWTTEQLGLPLTAPEGGV